MAQQTEVMPQIRASRGTRKEPGELVLGRYQLFAPLGSGGFGSVWAGYDQRLKREVAVKIVSLADAQQARFNREAFASARLNHPAIVQLYEAEVENDSAYLVSELVEGRTFAELIASGELTDRDIVLIGISLVAALAHAHTRDVIHRDVKPQNVLVPEQQKDDRFVAKLTDFGIARVLDEEAITRSGDVIGTLAYMSPEQAEGAHVTPATDVYSLALCLYEAFVGENPVKGRNPAETARNVGEPIPSLAKVRRDLPSGLTLAIDWALSPDPQEREELQDLETALRDALEVVSDEPTEQNERRLQTGLTYPARAVGASLAALSAAVFIAQIPQLRLSPLLAGGAALLLVAMMPRVGYLLCFTFILAYLGFQTPPQFQPAVALLPLLVATPLLLPKEGQNWPVPLLAPLLGALGLAGAFPAIAGQFNGVFRRAAIGTLGFLALTTVELALGSDLYLGSVAADRIDPTSFTQVLEGIAIPLFSSGVLLGAAIWALASALLPACVRGRNFALDFVGVAVWSGLLVGSCDALDDLLDSRVLLATPNGVALGAVLGALLALLIPRLRNSKAPSLFSTSSEQPDL